MSHFSLKRLAAGRTPAPNCAHRTVTHVHTITKDEIAVATKLAEQTLEMFAGKSGYYNNNLNSHLRGKLGEVAVSAYLRSRDVTTDDLWRDLDRISDADVVIPGRLRADVKTWDVRYWPEYGRCVSVSQFPKLRTKADAIIWCTSDSTIRPGMVVTIEGWSTMEDIEHAPRRHTGPPNRRQVHNHQLDPGSLREIATILRTDNV